jgi:hypothetical protein
LTDASAGAEIDLSDSEPEAAGGSGDDSDFE